MRNYSGDPNNVTSLSATIVQVTDTSPPVAQTVAAHLFATWDYVLIEGNGTFDGTYEITVVDATHFSLNGIIGSGGPPVAGGDARDLSLSPYFSIPDDGEPGTVDSIETSIQLLADRTQALAI